MTQLTFDEIVFITSFLSLIPIIILSIYWVLKKEIHSVVLRNISGFGIGILDQFLMIAFGWHQTIIPIVILFDYGLYGTWFLLMPAWNNVKRKKVWIPVWIIFSGVFNTILENCIRIYSYGTLNYPSGWNQLHTLIFYLSMHTIGTIIASLNIFIKQQAKT